MKTPPRVDPPRVAEERTMLEAWLDYHRATLLQKCDGLEPGQLIERSAPPSTLSLLGLVRHMTDVERGWFRRGVAGEDVPFLLDYDADPEADFDRVDTADAAEAFDAYAAEVEACRAAIAGVSLDYARPHGGEPMSVRWVMLHMIEEYARHNGHADLLRQRIDGTVGE